MKASEFRIGNYYNQFGNIEKVSWATLKVLEKRTNEQLWCEPIPLSEEWLLKFGFEMEYSQLTNIYKYFLVNTPFGYSQGQFNVFTQTGCFSVEIKYVHQLQNLYFALTNKELTYEQQK